MIRFLSNAINPFSPPNGQKGSEGINSIKMAITTKFIALPGLREVSNMFRAIFVPSFGCPSQVPSAPEAFPHRSGRARVAMNYKVVSLPLSLALYNVT